MKIFDHSITHSVHHKKPYRLYFAHFTATQAEVANLITNLKACVNNTPYESGTNYRFHYVTDSKYKTYNVATTNCFRGAAVFAKWLGDDRMMNIYNANKSDYKKYFAWRLYDSYHHLWTGGQFYQKS